MVESEEVKAGEGACGLFDVHEDAGEDGDGQAVDIEGEEGGRGGVVYVGDVLVEHHARSAHQGDADYVDELVPRGYWIKGALHFVVVVFSV